MNLCAYFVKRLQDSTIRHTWIVFRRVAFHGGPFVKKILSYRQLHKKASDKFSSFNIKVCSQIALNMRYKLNIFVAFLLPKSRILAIVECNKMASMNIQILWHFTKPSIVVNVSIFGAAKGIHTTNSSLVGAVIKTPHITSKNLISLLKQGMKQIVISLDHPQINALEMQGNKGVLILACRRSATEQIKKGKEQVNLVLGADDTYPPLLEDIHALLHICVFLKISLFYLLLLNLWPTHSLLSHPQFLLTFHFSVMMALVGDTPRTANNNVFTEHSKGNSIFILATFNGYYIISKSHIVIFNVDK